jgi:ribonuclease VapC
LIVVDTSALMAYLKGESQAADVEACLAASDHILISAGTLTEFLIVSQSRDFERPARRMLDEFEIVVAEVTSDLAFAAGEAHRRFGRRNHPAKLNFGDCFAYALARARELPLLYVGDDFAQTDVRSALA